LKGTESDDYFETNVNNDANADGFIIIKKQSVPIGARVL
jgi:hypothetical protein